MRRRPVSYHVRTMSDETRCPLCDGPNRCGIAAGQTDCWCFTSAVPEDVRARVADEDQGRRCICQRCAAGGEGPERSTMVEPAS
jgi:hypothetical protein